MSTATVVKERPLLMSGPMVKAILSGRKTQTRRLVKPQPLAGSTNPLVIQHPAYGGSAVVFRGPDGLDARPKEYQKPGTWVCPYGQPGDRLWVRETFVTGYDADDSGYLIMSDENGDELPEKVWYRATAPSDFCWLDENGDRTDRVPWKPSIHMPRRYSRITLELTEVRVQRLTEISSEDAIAEGFSGYGDFLDGFYRINAGRITYADNPYVWALSFRRLATP